MRAFPVIVNNCPFIFYLKTIFTILATIVSRMPRSFTNPTTGERMTREGNVYFHVNTQCIRAKQPYFQPNMVIVENWVRPHAARDFIKTIWHAHLKIT